MLCSENNPAEESLPTTPAQLFTLLETLGIEYSLHRHEPVFTVEESSALDLDIPGVHCRNLFLRDKKKAMFLVVAANETEIDLKKLQPLLNCGRLSFGSAERLWTHLGIRPGSVSPFTALNDPDHTVQVVLDAAMMQAALVNYHPLDNSMTISLAPADLMRFFAHTGHKPLMLDLTQAAPGPT